MKRGLQAISNLTFSRLLTFVTVLFISSNAVATTTYYVYGGDSSCSEASMKSWNTKRATAIGDDSNFEFTLDISGLSTNTTYYYGICRSSSQFLPGGGSSSDWNDHIITHGYTNSVSGVSIGKSNNNVGSCSYYMFTVYKTAAVDEISLSFSKTNVNYDQCDLRQVGWNITTGGESVDSWSLRGEFTNWHQNPVIFVNNNGTYNASIDLPAETEYRTWYKDEGFKIAKNGTDGTWYGPSSSTMITTNSRSATLDEVNGADTHNCGITTDLAGTYIFSFTLNGSGQPQVTVEYPARKPTEPIVRWGNAPTIDGSKNITASAYISAQGCDGSQQTVKQLRVRFWKEGDETNIDRIETSNSGNYQINTTYAIVDAESGVTTIPATNDILVSCTTPTRIYMEIAGLSDVGWSDYSDRTSVLYTATKDFHITSPFEKTVTDCNGSNQFNLSSIVKPEPTSFTATLGGEDVTESDFSQDGDVITWKKADKTSGTQYDYTFAFFLEGYPTSGTNTAAVNLTYSHEAPTGVVTEITTTATEDELKPFREITLNATLSPGLAEGETVKWYMSKYASSVELTPGSPTTSATFKAIATTSRTYQVKAEVQSADCTSSATQTLNIAITTDAEICPVP